MYSPLHFSFCVNDGYIPYICVTIKSIVENHNDKKIVIHVLTDVVSQKNEKLLNEAVVDSMAIVQVHIVDEKPLHGLKTTWSIYAWYRMLLPVSLPRNVHRVLYLDADTIVAGGVDDFFRLDMNGSAVAGCIDPESFNDETFQRCGYDKKKKYICSGVLLMNLDYWREHSLADKMIQWGRENNDRIKFPDQDTINVLCQDSKIVLPLKYGIMDYFFKQDRFYHVPYKTQLRDCIEHPAIVHYAGQNPWKRELANAVMQDEWDKYNKLLKHPVKKIYITKGWLLIKMIVWQALHPCRKTNRLTKSKILKRLEETI